MKAVARTDIEQYMWSELCVCIEQNKYAFYFYSRLTGKEKKIAEASNLYETGTPAFKTGLLYAIKSIWMEDAADIPGLQESTIDVFNMEDIDVALEELVPNLPALKRF